MHSNAHVNSFGPFGVASKKRTDQIKAQIVYL